MLETGKTYRITGFSSRCPAGYTQKLLAMGFVIDQLFKVGSIAPLGDPYQIEIQGTRVSLRKSELSLIEVREDESSASR